MVNASTYTRVAGGLSVALGLGFGPLAVYGARFFAEHGTVWYFAGFPTYGDGPFESIGIPPRRHSSPDSPPCVPQRWLSVPGCGRAVGPAILSRSRCSRSRWPTGSGSHCRSGWLSVRSELPPPRPPFGAVGVRACVTSLISCNAGSGGPQCSVRFRAPLPSIDVASKPADTRVQAR